MKVYLLGALLCAGCGAIDSIAPPPKVTLPPIAQVVVYTWPTYVQVGDTLRVEAGGFTSAGWEFTEPIRTVTWQTSNPDRIRIEPANAIVPIQPSIYARGVAPGTAKISASLNGITGSDSVIVIPTLLGIQVTPQSATIHVGESLAVTSRIVAADSTVLVGPQVVWTSSDVNVANFGPGGTVLGQHVGQTLISATLANMAGVLKLTVIP